MRNENESHSENGSRWSHLTIDHLGAYLGKQPLVRDLSLTVERSSIHCLVGNSGSGKTLTSLAAVGLLPRGITASGSIRLAGVPGNLLKLDQRKWGDIRGNQIGYVGQNALGCLHPAYTVEFQLVEAIRQHQAISRTEAQELALQELEAVDLANPKKIARSKPAELSGGMCQRVALAIALCNRPALLVADEPTTALDDETQQHVLALIRARVESDNLGVLLITHDQTVVGQIADQVTSIAHGVSSPGGLAPSIRTSARQPKLADSDNSEPVLEIANIDKTYRRRSIRRESEKATLQNISISATAGTTIGLVGRSGAGKTTLARIVAGILPPTKGSVRIAGRPITGPDRVNRAEKAHLVQYVFQDPFGSLNPRRTALAQVAEPLIANGAPAADAKDQARTLLDQVDLDTAQIDRLPTALSGGQCQRVGIARALIGRPRVVVLDEPVSALDWSIREEILTILGDLQTATEVVFLLIAHERPLIERQCDQVYEIADSTIRNVSS